MTSRLEELGAEWTLFFRWTALTIIHTEDSIYLLKGLSLSGTLSRPGPLVGSWFQVVLLLLFLLLLLIDSLALPVVVNNVCQVN